MPQFIESTEEFQVDLNYEVVAESEEFILINKSGNIPVHEGGRYPTNSLTKILEPTFGKIIPVYRLDRETSGLVLFAKKGEFVHRLFSSCSGKEYVAIVEGIIEAPRVLDFPIGEMTGEHVIWKKCVHEAGKASLTEIYPIKSVGNKTILKVIPKTGRQHQIRVHLSYIGHPVVNDKLYGESEEKFIRYLKGEKLPRQLLHMHKIKIYDQLYEAKLPDDFEVELKFDLQDGVNN